MTDNSNTITEPEVQDQDPEIQILSSEELATLPVIRDLVFKANPDVVPQLIQGESIADILASVEHARGAYERISERIQQAAAIKVNGESFMPVDARPSLEADVETLNTAEKIRFGLRERYRLTVA